MGPFPHTRDTCLPWGSLRSQPGGPEVPSWDRAGPTLSGTGPELLKLMLNEACFVFLWESGSEKLSPAWGHPAGWSPVEFKLLPPGEPPPSKPSPAPPVQVTFAPSSRNAPAPASKALPTPLGLLWAPQGLRGAPVSDHRRPDLWGFSPGLVGLPHAFCPPQCSSPGPRHQAWAPTRGLEGHGAGSQRSAAWPRALAC